MKRAIFVLCVFLGGCATTITMPDGTVIKGRNAGAVYAHKIEQEQLAGMWRWLQAESERETSKTATGEATRNMLMQTLVLAGTRNLSNGGGGYFRYLASRNEMWANIAQAALYTLGPALVQELLWGGNVRGSTEISEEINIGGDVIASNSGEFGFAPPIGGSTTGLVPEDSRAPAHQHRALSIGGIGNQVGTLESTNAFYRSLSGLNRRSGQLNMGSTEKPNSFLDNNCAGGPCQDDADDVRNEFGFLQ